MNERQRARAEAVYLDAIEQPAPEQERFARSACGDDAEVMREVLSLLEAGRDADRYFAELALAAGVPFQPDLDADEPRLEGRHVGPFRLLRELGRGGSGTVYLAERADGEFEQSVAIKLLRRGLDTDDVLARFRAERQILASLDHPNIARLLDGGATEDGRPYLVMEPVEGRSITTYCDERRCTVEERLRLFVQVARAVQHAHRRLVVHRDIKPSNILVTADGTPKLLDFGIAKLLDAAGGADGRPHTRTGTRLLTPDYASPEQMRGEPVGTASDAYQLGMLLYQLLCGRRPYRVPRHTLGEIERAVREQEPEPPSAALIRVPGDSEDGESAPDEVARRRRSDLRRLRARLRGDLDTIVLKSVRKEPDRRYATAGELADDVERYLAGRPVAARPDTVGYRARKLVGRRPGLVAAVSIGVLAVAAYSVTVTRYAERLEAERDRARFAAAVAGTERDRAAAERTRAEHALHLAEAERVRAHREFERAESAATRALELQRQAEADRDRAEREAVRAGQVTDFLVGLFEAADPARVPGSEPSVRELLDRGVARIDSLTRQPDVHAELSMTMARAYHSLGLYDEAIPLVDRVLTVREGEGGQALQLAAALAERGELLLHAADDSGAEPLFRQALEIRRRYLGESHPDIASSLTQVASVLRFRGQYADAEPLLREALAMRRRLLGAEHADVALSLNGLGLLLWRMGRDEEAEPLLREALTMRRRLFGDEHTSVATTLNNLGLVMRRRGDYEEAERLYRETLAIERRVLGEEHPTIATTLNNLGLVMRHKSDYAAAERLYRDALDMRRRLLGRDHPDVAQSLNNLGMLLWRRERYADAEPLLRRALEIRQSRLGEEHPTVAQSLHNLGAVLRQEGNLAEAEPLLEDALAMRRRLLGEDHPLVASSLHQVGLLLLDRGDHESAAAHLQEALGLRTRRLGAEHPDVAATRQALDSLHGGGAGDADPPR